MIAPAGFETYFVELGEAGDPARDRSGQRSALTDSFDSVAELISRYNLKLLGQ